MTYCVGQSLADRIVAADDFKVDLSEQIQLIVLEVVLIVLFGVWLYGAASTELTAAKQFLSARNIGVGFFLLPISIIFLCMALGNIRKDEKLIKSADRLR